MADSSAVDHVVLFLCSRQFETRFAKARTAMKSVALTLAMTAGASAKVAMPTRYHASVTMTMPYYGLEEPIEVWYDSAQGLERIDYYHGLDTYLYNTRLERHRVLDRFL